MKGIFVQIRGNVKGENDFQLKMKEEGAKGRILETGYWIISLREPPLYGGAHRYCPFRDAWVVARGQGRCTQKASAG